MRCPLQPNQNSMSRLPGGVWGAKRWAAALCILLPWAPACGGSGALTNASSNANSVGPSVDPASLSTPAKEIQVVSMANRNTCLRPQTGALAAAQDAVGTALCTGDANDSWRLDAKGTLSFGGTLCLVASASQAGLELAPCSDDPSQNITLFSGRLLLGASGSNQQAVAAADAAATRSDFTAAVVAAPSSTDGDPSQKWQIGLARPGLSGDANIYVSGFVMTLSASPTMCLTGRGIPWVSQHAMVLPRSCGSSMRPAACSSAPTV